MYIGINDVKNNNNLNQFTNSYQTMITQIGNTYINADIFVFTLLLYYYSSASYKETDDETLESFNDVIRNVL